MLTSWPLVLHLPSRIAPDLGDPVRTAWQIAWVGHAMLHNPLHLFDSNAFYPHPLSLAFSDSLLGYGPAAFFGSGTVAALVRYNLLFLFAWSLCFVGAYLLARELGVGRLGGAAAGVAFAYAPYRVTEAGHLHVISSGGIRSRCSCSCAATGGARAGWCSPAGCVSAWQISLGFTLGLQYSYLLLVLGVLVLVFWWRGRLTPGLAWEQSGRTSEPVASAVEPDGQPATPDGQRRRAGPEHRQARRERRRARPQDLQARSADPPPPADRDPGRARGAGRDRRLPGAPVPEGRQRLPDGEAHDQGSRELLLRARRAAVGLLGEPRVGRRHLRRARTRALQERGRVLPRRPDPRAGADRPVAAACTRGDCASGWLVGIVCSVLAMGLGLTGAGYPYRLLFDYAPGWNGVRVPGRIFTLATLFYALLAGAGVQLLARAALGPLGQAPSMRSLAPALARRRCC